MGTDDKSSPDPATLDYIRPLKVGPESKRYLRAAINCGATSLVIWLCVFGCCVVYPHPILMALCLLTIIAELVLVVVGLIWLMAFFECVPQGPKRFARFLSSAWPALLALFINFPATVLAIWSLYLFK